MTNSTLSKRSSRGCGSMLNTAQQLALFAKGAASVVLFSVSVFSASVASAQAPRWFTYELSVFSNENVVDRSQEPPVSVDVAELGMARARRLTQLSELLAIPEQYFVRDTEPAVLPTPLQPGESSYRFADLQRDPNIALPASASDFQQTNRALERSADYRLLYHAVWRAPLEDEGESTPLRIEGGLRVEEAKTDGSQRGERELAGTIDLHFNARRDRIVLDTQLSLDAGNGQRFLNRQSREMRSTEFHYLDSPALGVIFLAQPFEVPAEINTASESP